MKPRDTVNPAAKAGIIVGVSLVLGLWFDILFFDKIPGLSVVIYVAAIVAGLLALAKYLGRSLPHSVLWLLLPLGFFASMVAVRASYQLIFLNILACLFLLLLVAQLSFGDNLWRFNLIDYAKIPFLPLKFLVPLARTFADFFARRSAASSRRPTGQIVRGLLLALPLLAVFVVLFASADLVFQSYVTRIFNIHLGDNVVAQWILVAFVTLGFTGAYAYIFGRPADEAKSVSVVPSAVRLGQVETTILLGSVGVLFLLFIVVQLAYLFGGLANISGQGFTYAEYARKGFFELLLVGMMAFAMLWAADKFTAQTNGRHTLGFRLLSGLLIAEVLVIMASAFKRLYLYEQAFGFTTQRLYSHVFVIFLAIIFVMLLIKILTGQAENRFAFQAFVTAMVFLAALNVFNPDAFIAQQNLDRFHQTGKLDGAYMGSLTADAQSEIETALSVTTGETKQELMDALATRPTSNDWQSWNLARSRANQ